MHRDVNLGRAIPGDSPDEGLGDFATPECCDSCADDKGVLAAYSCYESGGCEEARKAGEQR